MDTRRHKLDHDFPDFSVQQETIHNTQSFEFTDSQTLAMQQALDMVGSNSSQYHNTEPSYGIQALSSSQIPSSLYVPQASAYLDHLNQTPCLDDLDTEFKFEVQVPMDEKEKKLWFYNPADKMVFVKGDQELTAIVSCKAKSSPLFVRLMPAYTSLADVRKPVIRCQNHKNKCQSSQRDHLVHCHHDKAVYHGSEVGETFVDRLSVLVPLRKTQFQYRGDDEPIKEEIYFSIKCLNSCSEISRRATGIIFTLENEQGVLLGRTLMNFRASTSPKRDFDARNKRRGEESSAQPSAKRPMIIKTCNGELETVVKQEMDHSSQESLPGSQSNSTEECILIRAPNKRATLKILTATQDVLSGEVTRGRPVNKKYFKYLAKQIDDVRRAMQSERSHSQE